MTIVGSHGAGTLEEAVRWVLRPEGLCRDETCVIVPPEFWSAVEALDAASYYPLADLDR